MLASLMRAHVWARVLRHLAKEQSNAATKPRRPIQRRPMLWPVRSHDARGRLVYCGPAAVSALTGIDADVLVRAIQKRRGNDQPVVGTEAYELHQACLDFGFEVLPVDSFDKPPTLASWERNRTHDEFEYAWILDVGDHWVAVRGWWLADSWFSKFEPIRMRTPGPHRSARVRNTYCIVVEGKQPN